ncbi:MAG: hypothetical protein AAFM92_03145 [Pseudomonadota bacterium]
MSRAKKIKRRINAGRPRKKSVTVTQAPWGGDHGTATAAAMRGTELVEVVDENGKNPNRMKRRQRVCRLDVMLKRGWITMRQHQAGRFIQDAYGRVQSLSSGGPLKERVQSSPKPDKVVASQVDAVSTLKLAMDCVPRSARDIVEAVCWHNEPMTVLVRRGDRRAPARLKDALDRVADRLRY